MKVFISWSGEPSKTVATALRDWLPSVIQKVKPWMSQSDLDAGVRWGAVLAKELNDTDFGIICLTKNNQRAPWLLFEAGALGKKLEETYVTPYLIHSSSADIESGPLTQFQAKQANQEDTWALVRTINKASDNSLEEPILKKSFDRGWPELSEILDNLSEEPGSSRPQRTIEDILEEVLDLVRALARTGLRHTFVRPWEGLTLSDISHYGLPPSLNDQINYINYLIRRMDPELTDEQVNSLRTHLIRAFQEHIGLILSSGLGEQNGPRDAQQETRGTANKIAE